jgi:signal transduction histidine kinase
VTTETSALDPVLHAWPEAMLVVSADGEVVSANACARRMLRLPETAPAALRASDVLGASAASALAGAGPDGSEFRIGDEASAAGRPVLRARAARLPDGGLLVRLDDVSEEHRLRSHLEHAERLASIGQMLSSVAHELANPLTTVLGYAELLLADDDPGLPREEIEKIREEALRCRRIVGNLLDLSRAEAFEKKPLQIAAVLDKVVEFRAYASQLAQIEVVRECAADVPVVQGDQHRLVQAVLNLVTNAEDAVRERTAGRRVVLRARRTDSGAAIDVEDNGPGVPEAIRSFVFEPFFTTKPRGRGTGLGLSLVQATAAAHGGSVHVGDAPGGGARFTIELPSG